jgi:hypothetical protein
MHLTEGVMQPGTANLGQLLGNRAVELDQALNLRGDVLGWPVLVNAAVDLGRIVWELLVHPVLEWDLDQAAQGRSPDVCTAARAAP